MTQLTGLKCPRMTVRPAPAPKEPRACPDCGAPVKKFKRYCADCASNRISAQQRAKQARVNVGQGKIVQTLNSQGARACPCEATETGSLPDKIFHQLCELEELAELDRDRHFDPTEPSWPELWEFGIHRMSSFQKNMPMVAQYT